MGPKIEGNEALQSFSHGFNICSEGCQSISST